MDMYKNDDIKNLVSLYEKDPDIVIKLLKEARCNSDEKFPRFSILRRKGKEKRLSGISR